MKNLIEEYKTFLKINRSSSEKTIKDYVRDLYNFFKILHLDGNNIKDLKQIKNDKITKWLFDVRKHNTNRTISRKIVAIKMYFIFLNEIYNIKNNDILNLTGLKFISSLPKAVQETQITEIIQNLPKIIKYKTNWELLRDKFLLILLFSTGMRISEASRMKHNDMMDDNFLIFGKGQKERIVPILNVVKDFYNKYKKELQNASKDVSPENFIFINKNNKHLPIRSIEAMFQKIKLNMNLQYFSPHIMRHSFATSLLENGAKIKQIQELLGHENLSTTQKYTKITKKIIGEKLKKIKW